MKNKIRRSQIPTEDEIREWVANQNDAQLTDSIIGEWLYEMKVRGWRFTGGDRITRYNFGISLRAFAKAKAKSRGTKKSHCNKGASGKYLKSTCDNSNWEEVL